jgi:hypothetical protein
MRFPLALAGVLLLAPIVLAHDRSGNPNWIADGHFMSPIDGSHCCGIADCVELHPDDVVQTNIRKRIRVRRPGIPRRGFDDFAWPEAGADDEDVPIGGPVDDRTDGA